MEIRIKLTTAAIWAVVSVIAIIAIAVCTVAICSCM
jgi:hypothetical protein